MASDERVPAFPQYPPDPAHVPVPAGRGEHVERDLLEYRRHEQVAADPAAPQPGQHRPAGRQPGHPQPGGDRLGQ